ncbi:MAG: ABC transporter permease [Hyphomicrobiales bacterium]|nr:ABC transporter permease [Hyphomicrobiales bacterium]
MRRMWRRFLTYRAGVLAAAYVLLLVLIGLATPFLPGPDPRQISNEVMQAPSLVHLLGTDELGRDVLSGIIHGIEVSLTVGFAAACAATVIGVVIGAAAGYYGGALDLLVMRIAEMFQVVPSFILAAVIVALSGPGLTRVVAVIALLAWPQVARLMRGEVMRIKGLEFVDAVRCLGVREPVILATEVVPNALAPVLAAGTLIVAQAILLEAALSFLGLSSADLVSWGRMLNSGQRFLYNAWWLSVFPGSAIFLTVLAFNLLGDAIGAALNPRTEA